MGKHAIPASPLDPFLVRFLNQVQQGSDGYQPGPETAELAESLDLPQAFLRALFTSARTRGLLKPTYGRGNRIRWSISPRGTELVDQFERDHAGDKRE